MNTDRELLENAAKAAGVPAYWNDDGTMQKRQVLVTKCGGGMGTMPYEEQWNPIRDSYSALWLAAHLRMEIDHNHYADLQQWVSVRAPRSASCAVEEFDDESQRLAATRRAIVRAAASLGEKM